MSKPTLYFVPLLVSISVRSAAKSVFGRKTTCIDFTTTPSNLSSQGLSRPLPGFRSELTPLPKGSKLYELRCPKVSLKGRRTVTGLLKVSSLAYTLRSCRFTARANRTEALESFGDIHGMTDRVEIRFVVTSAGLRFFCRLNRPRLKGNFAFFPPNFFATETKLVDGLNKLYLREGIMRAINGHLSRSVAMFLSRAYDCMDFFRISRH